MVIEFIGTTAERSNACLVVFKRNFLPFWNSIDIYYKLTRNHLTLIVSFSNFHVSLSFSITFFIFFFPRFKKRSEFLNKVSRSRDFLFEGYFTKSFAYFFKTCLEIIEIMEGNIRKKVNDGCPTS